MATQRTTRALATARPKHIAGALVAFVGISGANVLPPALQLAFYALGLLASLRRPHVLPMREISVVFFASAYAALAQLSTGMQIDGAFKVLRPCFEGFVVAQLLYKWCRIRSFRSVAIVLGGFVGFQFVITLFMAADQPVRAALLDFIYSDEAYQNPQFTAALLFRGYGFSRHHLYGLPLACGLSAVILLVAASIEPLAIWRRAMACIAIAAGILVAVNARVGFIPMFACYIAGLTLWFDRFYPKHLLALVALVILPIIYVGALYLGDNFDILWDWLGAGVSQFGATADQPDSTTLSDLRQMLVFSSNALELLFGSGGACSADMSCYSDIGIVRAIQEGGLVLLTAIVYLYIRLHRHLMVFVFRTTDLRDRRIRRAVRLLRFVTLLSFAAAMIKGEAYAANDYSRLVTTLAALGMLTAARTRNHATPMQVRHALATLHPSGGSTSLASEA